MARGRLEILVNGTSVEKLFAAAKESAITSLSYQTSEENAKELGLAATGGIKLQVFKPHHAAPGAMIFQAKALELNGGQNSVDGYFSIHGGSLEVQTYTR